VQEARLLLVSVGFVDGVDGARQSLFRLLERVRAARM